jgi:hypothetical protein
MAQINVPNDLEGVELIAEKLDRRAFVSILKEMLQLDQERRIDPDTALKHSFITMAHLVDYAHLNNVRMSFQMMEVCNKKAGSTGRLGVGAVPSVTGNVVSNNGAANNVASSASSSNLNAVVAAAAAAGLASQHHHHQQQQEAAVLQNAALINNFMPSTNLAAAFNGTNSMPLHQQVGYLMRYN